MLAAVGASHLAQASMDELSGGELQRVVLARALVREPGLLILDEPVQGVDFNGQLELDALIERIRQERGCGVLLVSHDLHLVMGATDQVVCLNRHVCCSGAPEVVSRHPEYRRPVRAARGGRPRDRHPRPRSPARLGRGRGGVTCRSIFGRIAQIVHTRPDPTSMLDDFLVRAVLGGIGVAAIAGPLGCFVVRPRTAYFGNALAHSALLGVGLGALLALDLTLSTVAICLLLAVSLVLLELRRSLATDTILGILAHACWHSG